MSNNISNMSYFDASDCSIKSEEKELGELFQRLKIEAANYERYNHFVDVVYDCLENDSLGKELIEKVRFIVNCYQVKPCMLLQTKDSDQTLLGLEDSPVKLSVDEEQKLNELLRSKMKLPRDNIPKYLECNENYDFTNLSAHDRILIDFKKKLVDLQREYVKKLLTHRSLLEQLLELRFKVAKVVTDTKIEECRLKSNLLQLRSEIIKQKATIHIFDEIPTAYDSYKTLLKDILNEQGMCKAEIDKLAELKEQYNQVSCKQYNQILEGYRQYKSALTKRKKLLAQIKNVNE